MQKKRKFLAVSEKTYNALLLQLSRLQARSREVVTMDGVVQSLLKGAKK